MFRTKNKLNNISLLGLLLFPIISFYFYRYVGFNEQILKAIFFTVVPITFLLVFQELIKTRKNSRYISLMKYIILLMLFSMIMAYLFWGQSLILSFRVTAKYLAVVYFFVLLYTKPNLKTIEKLIWFFCIVYLILWIVQMIKFPVVVFRMDKEEIEEAERGIRLFINGSGFLYLGFFMAISKFIETKQKKWILIFAGLFVIVILNLTRQTILFSFLVGLYYLLRNRKLLWLWMGLAVLLLTGINKAITIDNNSPIGKLIALTERQMENQLSGEEDIRILEYEYFLTKYSNNLITDILGNGVPHSESSYGKRDLKLKNEKKYFQSDVGYAQIFVYFGYIGLFLFMLVFYRVFKQKVPEKYMYAKLFLIYLFFVNIASGQILICLIELSLCLYILEYSHNLDVKQFYLKEKLLLCY